MAQAAGTRLGRYELRSLLGVGGMGEVYLAHDTQLRRSVALKLLLPELTQDHDRLRRFEQEAFAASALNHPNILTIYEAGSDQGCRFIATEFIDGLSLRQHIEQTNLELPAILDIAAQAAAALAAAHQAGIVHRDVKPENIMLRRDGWVKVLDFGLAKLAAPPVDPAAGTLTRTRPGAVMGTLSYMSPEQGRGLDVDPRSDVWSLGCVLYEMVARRPPFTAATASDLIAMILHKEPAPLARYAQEVPAELERIVTKTLRKNRDERYQSVKDLGLDLKSLKQHLEFEAERERTAPDLATPRGSGAIDSAETVALPAALMVPGSNSLLTRIREPKRVTAAILALLLAAVALAYVARSTGWGTAPIESIAVLPFVNASGDPGAEYLSDGITENLIDRLSELPQLKVIAQASAFRYKGKTVDPREVGRALDVRGVLMGRVARRGDDLEVSAELVDARQQTHVWGSRYHRRAADVQAIQADIVRALAEKLHLQVAPGRTERPATANAGAYEAYLNGRYYARSFNPGDQRKALGYYTRASDLDPGFAPAYSGIAMFYLVFANSSFLEPREALPKAREAAVKALALDDGLAEAHLALGNLALNDWSWPETGREYRRAIELSPNLAEAHFAQAAYLATLGRTAESLAEIQRARALDPLGLRQMLYDGIVLQRVRHNDEAIRVLRDLLKIDPENSLAHVVLGYSYAYRGRYAEAIAEYREHLRRAGENNSTLAYMGCAYALSGHQREALALLDRLKATKDYVSPAELAVLYVGLGDREGAFAALERAYREHDLQLRHLKTEQHYDPLRSDPRFNDLLRRVGLTP